MEFDFVSLVELQDNSSWWIQRRDKNSLPKSSKTLQLQRFTNRPFYSSVINFTLFNLKTLHMKQYERVCIGLCG